MSMQIYQMIRKEHSYNEYNQFIIIAKSLKSAQEIAELKTKTSADATIFDTRMLGIATTFYKHEQIIIAHYG